MSASTTLAPDSVLYRTLSTDDAAPFQDKKQGLNCGHYRFLNVEVIPAVGANPAVTVYVWSEEAGAFITTGTTIAAAGAGVAHAFSFEARGRLIFLGVTGTAGNEVKLATNGYGLDGTL